MSEASDTTRCYRIEETWLHEEWDMDALRILGNRIWRLEAPLPWRWYPPTIVARDGMVYGGRRSSFTVGRSIIVLARNQRDPKVLVHELTHALRCGDWRHNKRFEAHFCRLLRKYKIKVEIKPWLL